MANIESHMEGWVCSDCGHAWTFMEVEDGHEPDNCPKCQDFNALWSEACSRGVSSPREAALYVFLSLRDKADRAKAKQVIIPATPTVEILTAMSVALGIEPLTDGSDGSYPITGAQSTVRRCYAAIVQAPEQEVVASAEKDEDRHSAVKAIHDVMAVVPCSSLYSLAEAVHDAGYTHAAGVLEPVGYAKVTGTLDEIDAIAWPFINAEAVKVGPQYGRIEAYRYERANGGVIVLWNANRIHAITVTVRDDLNCTRCVRMLAAQDG